MFGYEWLTITHLIVIYLIVTALMTAASILRMRIINRRANDIKRGKNRIQELTEQGNWKQIPLYSFDEIAEEKRLGEVRLSIFPSEEGKGKPYVLICPGGGYAHLCTDKEGYTIAAHANELGYTAFVLEYRTGLGARRYAPLKDLARAMEHISEHADEYQVDPKAPALMGFSAGGNLIGLYGSKTMGYVHHNAQKPGTLIMGYPWTNMNHWLDHPYWNIWKGLIGIYFTERGNLFLLGRRQGKESRDSLCVQKWIDEDYPPTYMFSGGLDVLTPASRHADVMEQALKEHNVTYMYRKFFRLPHGIGLGVNTQAEGWMEEALAFWEEQRNKQIENANA